MDAVAVEHDRVCDRLHVVPLRALIPERVVQPRQSVDERHVLVLHATAESYPTRHGTLLVSLWPARRATAAYGFRGDFVDVVEEIVRDLPGDERLHLPQRAIEVGDYNNE